MIRSWVAQVVDDARTTRTGGSNFSTVQCAATSGPTSSGQRPSTVPTSSEVDQPCSRAIRPSPARSGCGSRGSAFDPV